MSENQGRRGFLGKLLAAGAGVTGLQLLPARVRAMLADEAKKEAAKVVPRKALGKTGVDIPILVLGCAQRFDPKYDKILHRCFKEGVDYLDTALVYAGGQSHKTIAPFLKQIESRDKIWITSKAPHRRNRATEKSYQTDLETCLKQLEVDYLDLFFMHGLDDVKYVSKKYVAMGEKMKKEKKIRFFGFSCHDGNVVELMNEAAKIGGIDAIMFRFSYGDYGNSELNKAIDACHKAGIGLIAMKTQRSIPRSQEEVVKFQSLDFNLPQAKLKYVWEDERIASAVSHMDNVNKVKENTEAAKSPVKLTRIERKQLIELADVTSALSCQGCSQHCEPKAGNGLKIADQLRYLMYAECYGELDKARGFYRAMLPSEKALDDADLDAATKACPAGIDIAARLQKARDVLT